MISSSQDGRVKEVIVDSRINKVLSMRTDSVAMLEALDSISEFYIVNTVEARRSLRQDLEYQNIQLAKKFLIEFNSVKEKINHVEDLSLKLEESCQGLAKKVSEADLNMKEFLKKASELEQQKNSYIKQSNEIKSFLSRFQLSSEEIEILYNSSLDSTNTATQFFSSLKRLRKSYNDCKKMIESHTYTAGFELLDSLGTHQDYAYQRLFEWVKAKCELLENNANPSVGINADDIDAILQMAIRYLRKLPIYYSQCQDLVINSRRTQLVQKFIIALTQGPSGQLYRAIDLHANDSARYISDMLAWMHQALASEEEFLQVIFGPVNVNHRNDENTINQKPKVKPDDEATNSSNKLKAKSEDEGYDDDSSLQGLSLYEILARCVQGLGRPLRIRITQTLESRPPLEIVYSILDLLAFYEATFHKLVPLENAVHSTTKGCYLECKRLFQSMLSKQAEALIASPASCPLDLTASISTKECAKQIRDMLKISSTALSTSLIQRKSNDGSSSDDYKISDVLESIIQPLLQSCRLSGQSLSQADMAIFMLNNITLLKSELKDRYNEMRDIQTILTQWLDLLKSEANTWLQIVVTEEASRTLRRSDIDKLLDLVVLLPEGIVASQQPGLSNDRVGTVMRAFYASLFSTVSPQFDRLVDSELREMAHKQTAEYISKAHAKVYNMISLDANGYDKSMLSHTIGEVAVILGYH